MPHDASRGFGPIRDEDREDDDGTMVPEDMGGDIFWGLGDEPVGPSFESFDETEGVPLGDEDEDGLEDGDSGNFGIDTGC